MPLSAIPATTCSRAWAATTRSIATTLCRSGGAGNDTYVVDNAGDTIADSSGIDRVQSSIAYTLGTALENLTLTGTGDINGIGNALNNAIVGNTGNNLLTGLGGNDS